ncbi:unnamed protein product [Rotaria magnacalcarata]|uniref:Uncharacterized protein n=1 Tax=Rotaria magnacalcarata TaxID=392030 RepID=A0A820MJY5_9BILA|nr:unnamed protein product [Rotaria magnacalcarata]CAF4375361.1 unnamed protein product [Rotaria magnacalcarata]
MQAAIYEAVDENDGDSRALTVSGDRTWQKRSFKSIHGIAAILSASRTPKVFDVEHLSKKVFVWTDALSIKNKIQIHMKKLFIIMTVNPVMMIRPVS